MGAHKCLIYAFEGGGEQPTKTALTCQFLKKKKGEMDLEINRKYFFSFYILFILFLIYRM